MQRILFLLVASFAFAACSSTETVTTAPPTAPPVTEAGDDGEMMDDDAPMMEEEMDAAPALIDPDTVQAGRFDNGRMFTFDDPPRDYLRETYGFAPGDDWFERARLGALRLPNCSASFVSPNGLILTNHHCARESATQVTMEGEDLGRDGFFAGSLDEERRVEDLYVDQLIDIVDVTDRVRGAVEGMETDAERVNARQEEIAAIEEEMGSEDDMVVQVISLYNGGRYSAYVFRRYDDVRLAFAPEDALGYYGGDYDNFTYPRYALDFALFRAYSDDGEPLDTEANYFPWSDDGTEPGELVFVIGNPGSTTRLQSVAQLEYRRDIQEPAILALYDSRANAYDAYVQANPDAPGTPEYEDTFFGLSNARKAYTGRVEGLRDPYVIARRAAAEDDFRSALTDDADLSARYEPLFDQVAQNRQEARALGAEYGAFLAMNPGSAVASNVLTRALYAFAYGQTQNENLRNAALSAEEDRPEGLEVNLLAARFQDFVDYFGADSDFVEQVLDGRSPQAAAAYLVENSAFATAEGTEAALDGDLSPSADPALAVASVVFPRFAQYQSASAGLNAQVEELNAELGRARYEVYGTAVPPDATFSLRINDGVVRDYEYNGTVAPPYTTFYGLYDHYYSYRPVESIEEFFDLPARWLPIPDALDLTTPFNFVTTNDIIGGNSGSPMLNRDLEIVGVAFDGNIQSLPGNYIYLDEQNRTVGVDSRGMMEALESVYDAERLVDELRTGTLVAQ